MTKCHIRSAARMTLPTLSLNASAQVVQPTVVQRVEPTYASTANYVADPAVVKLVIDEHGDLFSLQSATSLPDNVVQALSKWKFRPGTQNGKPVAFTVPIALSIRRSADEIVKLTSRPSLTDDGPWPAAVQEGLKLTPENAPELYGLSALGVKKLDAVSGLPTETSAILPDAGFGIRGYLLLKRYGQQLCKSSNPKCDICPVATNCAFAPVNGETGQFL